MSVEKELEDLKITLRSLVVSSPTKVDVRSLLRDYRSLVGEPLPLSKFGYRDPVTFFKERCADSFVLQGLPSNPVLTLIVRDTLTHIDKMVQKQKSTGSTKLKGKRTSIPEPLIRRNNNDNLVVKTFQDKNVSNGRNVRAETPNIDKLNITYKPHTPVQRSESKQTDTLDSNNTTSYKYEHTSTETNSDDVQKFLKKRLPQYTSQNMDNNNTFNKNTSFNDRDSGIQSSSYNFSKQDQLEELQSEIHDIIKDSPNGIWCMELMRLYRERYKRELNFTRFGFMSVVSLVKGMGARVRVTRPRETGDWRLQDAAAPPAPAPPPPAPAAAPPRPRSPDPEDALPGIDFDPDVFPADCVHYVESVPAPELGALRPGAMLPVIVGEVYSPAHFWMLRLGERYNMAMEDIMDEMTAYFKSEEGKARFLAPGAVRVGHYCSSLYDGDWHRSLIVAVVDADRVKVRHVDYGTVETVLRRALRPLRREWARLPAQAVRARLAALRPPPGTRRYTHAAAAHFLALVKQRRLVANVVALDEDEETVETFLVDTSAEDDVCLSAEMIRAGHAVAREDSALGADELYLYPRFDALESGATPNLGEIDRYLRAGVALEYVESYRRHVPTALPAPASPPASVSPPPASPPPAPSPDSESQPPDRPLSPMGDLQTQIPLLLPGASDPLPPSSSPAPLPAVPVSTSTPAPTLAPAPAPPPPARPTPSSSGAATSRGLRSSAPPFVPMACAPAPFAPPPGFGPMGEAGSVRLTAKECQMYKMLCAMDPLAAQCYMTTALQRAQQVAPAPQLAPAQQVAPAPQLVPAPQLAPAPPVLYGAPAFAQPHYGPPPFGPPHIGPPPFGPPPFGQSYVAPPPPFRPPPGF